MSMYRLFCKTAHAEDFLRGAIRFGHLNAYRAIEQVGRRDPSEGFGRHREHRPERRALWLAAGTAKENPSPGEVTVYSEAGNPIYLCCLTQPPGEQALARIRQDFGDVVVEVSDVDQLVADIRAALDQNDPWQRRVVPQFWPAAYDKDELIANQGKSDPFDAIRREATQKAPEYAYQHEHRIVLFSHGLHQVDGPAPDYLPLQLAKPLGYGKLV
jgi:hypothetical protein